MSSQSFFVLQNKVLVKQKSTNIYILMLQKLRGKDLNQRPPGYEPTSYQTALSRDVN